MRKIGNRYTRIRFSQQTCRTRKVVFGPGRSTMGRLSQSLFRAQFRVSQACITLPTRVFAEGGKVSLFKRVI